MAALHPSWVGFCHNDLQYGNMLLFPPTGSGGSNGGVAGTNVAQLQMPAAGGGAGAAAGEAAGAACAMAPANGGSPANGGPSSSSAGNAAATTTVKLIDYEYSTLNDVGFDVANHFCEWAYNYHSGGVQRLPVSGWDGCMRAWGSSLDEAVLALQAGAAPSQTACKAYAEWLPASPPARPALLCLQTRHTCFRMRCCPAQSSSCTFAAHM